jgi:hypothetical protein
LGALGAAIPLAIAYDPASRASITLKSHTAGESYHTNSGGRSLRWYGPPLDRNNLKALLTAGVLEVATPSSRPLKARKEKK